MANLLGNDIGLNYKGLLNLDTTINTALDGTLRVITDGEGDSSPLYLSTTAIGLGTTSIWDNTNGRLGIGTSTPTATGHFKGSGSTFATFSLLVQDSASTNLISLRDDGLIILFAASKTGQLDIQGGASSGVYAKAYNSQTDNILRFKDYNGNTCGLLTMTGSGTGNLTVNNGVTSLNATLGVKGSGSDATTTSLLVQNSVGNRLLQSYDDRSTHIHTLIINGENTYNNWGFKMYSGGAGLGYIASDSSALGMPVGVISIGARIIIANSAINASSNNSSILEVVSTTQGFLPPRMTSTQKNAIATPAAGLMVYDSDLVKLCVFTTVWETITSI